MANGRFVSYLRVSTDRQGRSGLGIDGQREAVRTYLNGGSWSLVGEVVEIESGRRGDRPELERALELCRAHRASLVVARVDRLTRSVAFLSKLLEAGVDVRFCDLPQIEGATGRFMLQQMASVAELEAGLIGERTRKALKAAKDRGKVLGGVRISKATGLPRVGTSDDTARARAARTAAANDQASAIAPIIKRLDPTGAMSLRQLASALNAEGVPTAAGSSTWTATGVSRLRARIP